MAVTTVVKSRNHVFGDRRVTVTLVTFDNSYTTGGESLTADQLGLSPR